MQSFGTNKKKIIIILRKTIGTSQVETCLGPNNHSKNNRARAGNLQGPYCFLNDSNNNP